MRVLITGSDGFVGRHLLHFWPDKNQHSFFEINDSIENWDELLSGVKVARPDLVIHLAGISHVPTCEKDPGAAYRVNVLGTAHLLEAIKVLGLKPSVFFASSAQVYRAPLQSRLLRESDPTEGQNVYGRTKLIGEKLVQWAAEEGFIEGVILRLFNHSHMSQPPVFFLPSLYRQLSEATGSEVLVGNLNLFRDIGSIQDLVMAFYSVMKKPKGVGSCRIFNVSSGQAKNLEKLAVTLMGELKSKKHLKVDPSRFRPGEVEHMAGDPSLLMKETGWRPTALNEGDLVRAFLEPVGEAK